MTVTLKMQLISKKITEFYIKNIRKDTNIGKQYFLDNLSLDFDKIHKLLLSFISRTSSAFQDLTYEDFLHCYVALQPVFSESVPIVKDTKIECLNLQWLGTNFSYLVISLSSEQTKTKNVENVLLLTAMLEYALGSVYYTLSQKRTPPHLLRDLLLTEELLDFFGLEAVSVYKNIKKVTLLRILLGIPNSINLRNIVWHGFPKPDDIPTYYVTILLVIVHSLGITLEEKKLVLTYRIQVDNFSSYMEDIMTDEPFIKYMNPTDINTIIENCSFIDPEYKVYWHRLLYFLATKKHWCFVILILPQIELLLRLKYAKANDFDVSAKLDEYYITMDTIFEPLVPDTQMSTNQLFSKDDGLSSGALNLLYDLFIAPNGPRLRDKVGHGEVNIDALNNEKICDILMYLSLHLLSDNDIKFNLNNYESKFHLNCRTKNAIADSYSVWNHCAKDYLEINEYASNARVVFKERNLRIFLRPKREPVYMLLIFKIANSITKICRNYGESVASCQALMAQHELRSRRRRTFKLLMESLPQIFRCLENLLNCLLEVFRKLQDTTVESDIESGENLLRFLKHSLKISENFMKYSHKESNEWIKAIELCNSFNSLREKFLLN